MKTTTLMACAALALAACEQADAGASGPLGGSDTTLLAGVPSGNVALFGGNYMKFQNFMQSWAGQVTGRMLAQSGGGEALQKWITCFAGIDHVQMLGGVAWSDAGVLMRSAFRGMTLDDVSRCASQSGLTATPDPDGKYVAVQVPIMGTTLTYGYLQLADGALYTRQSMKLGAGVGGVGSASRADLEADVASLAKGNAADDTQLLDLAAKVDRRHAFWFAGALGATPLADKVGDLYGSLDFDGGLQGDATLTIADDGLASKITGGFDMARKMSDRLPADIRSALDGIHIDRNGKQVHVRVALTADQMTALTSMAGMGMH